MLLVSVLGLGIGLWAVADQDAGVSTWLRVREELSLAQDRVGQLTRQVDALRGEIEALRHDPFALERAIREDLELARPGETVVRFAPRGETTR